MLAVEVEEPIWFADANTLNIRILLVRSALDVGNPGADLFFLEYVFIEFL